VRRRTVLAAYVAGVGTNALLPARGGDLLRLYLVRRHVPGSTYTALGTTLAVETPAGIGTEQALLVFALFGEAAPAAVLSFSVGMRLVLVAVNAAAGALALLLTIRTLRWRRVVACDRDTDGAAA
jgi:hypothetical protein